MTSNQLTSLIQRGETETVEFKQSFNKAVIETLVAFSNTKGGQVLVGVKNDKTITGVDITEETVQMWINEIKGKTAPPLIPNAEIIPFNEKSIVVLSVQEYR